MRPTPPPPLMEYIISKEASDLAENYLAEGSETSSFCQSRILQLEDVLREEGYEDEEVTCTLQTIYLVTWLEEVWNDTYESHQIEFRE